MGAASRKLGVGDWAVTDYNNAGSPISGPLARVQIVAVDRARLHGHSQSGVMFQVRPPLKYGTPDSWYCADWFEPVDRHEPPNVAIEP
jgi:hypothetical protein